MFKMSDDANLHHSKQECSLWDENHCNKSKCISVKTIFSKDGYHSWKLFENNACKIIINSSDITKKLSNFLFTTEGLTFLIDQYKKGCCNLYNFKKAVKEHVKNNLE